MTRINKNQIKIPGGTTGQGLLKQSNSDYDYDWGDVSGSGGGGGGTKLAVDTTQVSLDGSGGAASDDYTISIPAGTLDTNNVIRFEIPCSNIGVEDNTANGLRVDLIYGATTIATATLQEQENTGDLNASGRIVGYLMADNSATAQKGYVEIAAGTGEVGSTPGGPVVGIASAYGTAVEDSGTTLDLTVQFRVVNGGGNEIDAEAAIFTLIAGSGVGDSGDKFVGVGEATAKSYQNYQIPFNTDNGAGSPIWNTGGSEFLSYISFGTGTAANLTTDFGQMGIGGLQYNDGKEVVIEVPAVISASAGGDGFIGSSELGLATVPITGATANVSLGFLWDDTAGLWKAKSSDGSGTTETALSSGNPAAGTHTFRIVYDPANTQALFYVDGVLEATLTTDLPTAQTPNIGLIFGNAAGGGRVTDIARPSIAVEI